MVKKGRNEKFNESNSSQKTARQDVNNHDFDEASAYLRNSSSRQHKQQQANQEKYDRRIHDSKDYSSFKVVLFYCSLIVFLPVVTFFLLKIFLLDLFAITEIQSNIYAAVGAVIALHFALGVYIYRAYFSVDTAEKKRH